MRVLIVEPAPLAGAALRALVRKCLHATPGATPPSVFLCDATTPARMLREAARVAADAVMFDAGRTAEGCAPLCRRFVQAGRAVVLLAGPDDASGVAEALAAAQVSVLSKASSEVDLACCLRDAAAGRGFVSADLAGAIARAAAAPPAAVAAQRLGELTVRERAVLRLLSEGHGRGDISALLRISPKTVSTYRNRVMRKLDLRTDVQLARFWLSG